MTNLSFEKFDDMTNFSNIASRVGKKSLLVFFLVFAFSNTQAREISALYDSVATYIRIYDKASTVVESTPDDEFYKSSISIPFVVNTASFDSNKLPQYQQLKKDLPSLLSQDKLRLHSIEVRGGASPEGSLKHNAELSGKRAQYLIQRISEDFGVDVSNAKIASVPEDYQYLARMVEEANDPQKKEIIDIVNKYDGNPEATKAQLKRLPKGGWNRLLKKYFPSLRAARIIIKFVKVEEEPVQPVLPVVEEPVVETVVVPVDTTPVVEPPVVIPVDTASLRLAEPMLSVKNNLLYDAFWMPRFGYAPVVNIMAEYYPHNSRWSFVLEYDFPWWYRDAKHKYFQILNWTAEARRYFQKKAVRTGLYIDGYAQYNYWDFSFNKEDGYQGEGFGVGAGIGYVWRLGHSKRWKIEVSGKVGFYNSVYDPYHAGDPYKGKYYYDWDGAINEFVRRNHGWTWVGPTGLGVTISYDLLFRTLKGEKKFWNIFKSSDIDPDTLQPYPKKGEKK